MRVFIVAVNEEHEPKILGVFTSILGAQNRADEYTKNIDEDYEPYITSVDIEP